MKKEKRYWGIRKVGPEEGGGQHIIGGEKAELMGAKSPFNPGFRHLLVQKLIDSLAASTDGSARKELDDKSRRSRHEAWMHP